MTSASVRATGASVLRDRARRAAALVLLSWAGTLVASVALAQHGSEAGQAPPPPPGPGAIFVELVTDDETLDLEGIEVGLFALANGQPGVANGLTDAEGRAVFRSVSNDPDVIYLVGATIGDLVIPERLTFTEGQLEARLTLAVANPTTDTRGVTVEEVRVRIDWMGDRVVVTEIVSLANPGTRVIRVPSDPDGPAVFERRLPDGARDFAPGPSAASADFTSEDGRVRFYGPLYAGPQRVEYTWSLPLEGAEPVKEVELRLREAVARIVVVAGTAGLVVEGDGLVPSRTLADDDAQPLESWARDGLGADEPLRIAFTLPETRRDPGAITLPRADVWVDFDDTRVEANADLSLVVSPGAPVSGTPSAPLLHVSIPSGATLEGVAQEAEAFGLVPSDDGGFDVIGPIGPGEHSIAFKYRMPSRPDGVDLDLRFPREVQTLNVLVADTGLALESSRLHRRRPFRNRTRNYLHREAYNVGMHETVDLRLAPLRGGHLPQEATLALTILGVAGAAWFMISPLRRSQREAARVDPTLARIREEREGVYADIADLDHDFETGKLEAADYEAMRGDLRGQAIELLREERAHAEPAEETAPETASAAPPRPEPDARATSAPIATGAFCPSCGGRVDVKWKFCSHCGESLTPAAADGAEG